MAKSNRPKGKSGNKARRFCSLPHSLLDQNDYIGLSHVAKSFLIELLYQYNGFNNGDFCITLSVLKKRGWNSNDTIRKAAKELIDANLLVMTRQGGRNMCNLYGFTWIALDECKNKLDIKPSVVPIRPLSIKSPVPNHGIQNKKLNRHTVQEHD
jgi:hypothetical protein